MGLSEMLRGIFGGGSNGCTHLDMIKEITPSSEDTCPQCVAVGDTWVNLRVCLICGRVGCCDDSKNTHATEHYQETGHALIQSFQPGEGWRYCYVDETTLPEVEPFRR